MPVASTMIEFRLATVLHAVGPRQVAHRPHHQRRADRDHLGDPCGPCCAAPSFSIASSGVVTKPCTAERAVVGGVDHVELVAELRLQPPDALVVAGPEQQVGAAEPGDQRDVVPAPQVLAHDRVHRRQPDAAGGEHDRLVDRRSSWISLGRPSGPAMPANESPTAMRFISMRARADALDHEVDRAGLGVPVGERERDQLAVAPAEHAHELAGPGRARDQRRADRELHDAAGELGPVATIVGLGLAELGVARRPSRRVPAISSAGRTGSSPTISRAAAWPSPAARIAVEPPRAASPPE